MMLKHLPSCMYHFLLASGQYYCNDYSLIVIIATLLVSDMEYPWTMKSFLVTHQFSSRNLVKGEL